MSKSFKVTQEVLAKRAERALKKAQACKPEAKAAAAERAHREAEAKRESRRLRDEAEAAALQEWAVRSSDGQVTQLVDIGCNLTKLKSDDSIKRQLRRCSMTGVGRVMVTGTSVRASQEAAQLVQRMSAIHEDLGVAVYCTAGVHPHDARTCDEHTLQALRELAQQPGCVAVGECGLDYDRMFSSREVQLHWFEQQVELAVELDMPLFLHERDRGADKGGALGSHSDLLHILEQAKVPSGRVCIHCFTGSHDELQAYLARGYYVGLTGFVAMQARGARVREALRIGLLPLAQLMLETDSPFMKPDKEYLPNVKSLQRGQCEPCCLPAVCQTVAECLECTPDVVANVTTSNALRFFRVS